MNYGRIKRKQFILICLAWVLTLAFLHECQAQNKSIIKFGNSGPNTIVTGVDSLTVAMFTYQENDGVSGQDDIFFNEWHYLSFNTTIHNEVGIIIQGDTALLVPPGQWVFQDLRPYSGLGDRIGLRWRDLDNNITLGAGSSLGASFQTWAYGSFTDTTLVQMQAFGTYTQTNFQFGLSGDGEPEVYGFAQVMRVGDAEILTGNIAQDILSFAVEQATSFYGVGNDNLGEPAAADGAIVVGKTAGSDTAQTVSDFRYVDGEMGINIAVPDATWHVRNNPADGTFISPKIYFERGDTIANGPILNFRRQLIQGGTKAKQFPKTTMTINAEGDSEFFGVVSDFTIEVEHWGVGLFQNPVDMQIFTTDMDQVKAFRWGIDTTGAVVYADPVNADTTDTGYGLGPPFYANKGHDVLVRDIATGRIQKRGIGKKLVLAYYVPDTLGFPGFAVDTGAWINRPLNSLYFDQIGTIVRNASDFELKPGKYEIEYYFPESTRPAGSFQNRLWNVTDSVEITTIPEGSSPERPEGYVIVEPDTITRYVFQYYMNAASPDSLDVALGGLETYGLYKITQL